MNYFNYFTEIEDVFVRRRGKHLFLSPIDWALMETWKQQGIPLHIVLLGVERAFDSYEKKPRKRTVKTLLYCQEEVEAQHAEWLESRVGANSESTESQPDPDKTPFTPDAIREHLQHARKSLNELAQRRAVSGVDELTEALNRAVAVVESLENDLETNELETRKLEDSLTGLERLLNHAMFASLSSAELEKAKTEINDRLKAYKRQMDTKAYQQTFDNLLLKSLRDQLGIPRLSLFYL
jgi:myosin heavy subunit